MTTWLLPAIAASLCSWLVSLAWMQYRKDSAPSGIMAGFLSAISFLMGAICANYRSAILARSLEKQHCDNVLRWGKYHLCLASASQLPDPPQRTVVMPSSVPEYTGQRFSRSGASRPVLAVRRSCDAEWPQRLRPVDPRAGLPAHGSNDSSRKLLLRSSRLRGVFSGSQDSSLEIQDTRLDFHHFFSWIPCSSKTVSAWHGTSSGSRRQDFVDVPMKSPLRWRHRLSTIQKLSKEV